MAVVQVKERQGKSRKRILKQVERQSVLRQRETVGDQVKVRSEVQSQQVSKSWRSRWRRAAKSRRRSR